MAGADRLAGALRRVRRDEEGARLAAAQASGDVRDDVQFMDMVRMVGGIATIPTPEPGQVERILAVALDGLRPR